MTPQPSDSTSLSRQSPAPIVPERAIRCCYRTPRGRRCRAASAGNSLYCARHAAAEAQSLPDELAALLAPPAGTFGSAQSIDDSLAKLFTLVAEDRISPRRAAVLGYIGSLLLRSRAMKDRNRQLEAAAAKKPPRIIWDLPRPLPDPRLNADAPNPQPPRQP